MAAIAQQKTPFGAETEASLYHNPARFGFFSVLSSDGIRKTQHSYRLPDMATVLRLLPRDRDTWLSQAEFILPNRRVVNLARLTSLFIDVDCYKLGIDANSAESLLIMHCEEERFPLPSIVIKSGRGLQVKWLLEKPLPRHALPRWNAAQRYLVSRFEFLGADPAARDASRVLRLVETINTKTGDRVEVSWANTTSAGDVALYGFDFLTEFILPLSRDELEVKREGWRQKKEQREQKTKLELKLIDGNPEVRRGFSNRQLAWHRMEDLRTLYQMRDGEIEGLSMPLLFWSMNFLLLSGATCLGLMWHEAAALCKEFGMGEFRRKDELGTLYAKAKSFEAGKVVSLNGRVYPELYTPKNATLIDVFQISPEEQRHLKTIIGQEECKDRDRCRDEIRRRAAGELPRAEYLASHEQKRATARLVRAQGKTWAEVAIVCGYASADTARKACA